MSSAWRVTFFCILTAILGMSICTAPTQESLGDDSNPAAVSARIPDASLTLSSRAPKKSLYKGRVVRVIDALKQRGIKAYSDELKDQVALEAENHELIPILPDWRGRAFYQDERLRNRDVELIGLRRDGIPYLNVLSVYTFGEKGERQYTDYWCDICSIPMYEIKPCDCCQQDIRIRFQLQELPQDLNDAKTAKPVSPK